jgi:hypothetical protein
MRTQVKTATFKGALPPTTISCDLGLNKKVQNKLFYAPPPPTKRLNLSDKVSAITNEEMK